MTFPLMPNPTANIIPKFSVEQRYFAAVAPGDTLDVSPYVTSSFSTLLVVQMYAAPGGGESFYYPPTTKLNGVNMPLIASVYTNAYDDGNGWSVSSQSVPKGSGAILTWTSLSLAWGMIFEVTGFTNMASSVYSVASSVNLTSGNDPAPLYTTVNTTELSKVLFISIGGITVGTDISGQMDQSYFPSSWEIGFDLNPTTPSNTYYGGNRGTTAVAFNSNY